MLNKLCCISTDNVYPYRNLAVEEYLTLHVPEGVCILFLWQNRRTVVIGRNQNSWQECRVSLLEEEGGYLVRRLSGGGAVFHDMGNLNFTFIVRKADYDVERQLQVILEAVRLAGIEAEKTGRNDVTVEGRKFSGNAFYQTGDCCYHHGTLLIQADKGEMSRYLNVSKEKLASKGVKSVQSRVANLCEFSPGLTVAAVKEYMKLAFSSVYGLPVKELRERELPEKEIQALTERFEAWEWKYGRRLPFTHQLTQRFGWGGLQLQLRVNEGLVKDAALYSDAMEQELLTGLEKAFLGLPYEREAMERAVEAAGLPEAMKADIVQMIRREV